VSIASIAMILYAMLKKNKHEKLKKLCLIEYAIIVKLKIE